MESIKKIKNILVTGAAGFVGSSMSEKQLEHGHCVHGIDNLITGSKENISRLLKYPNFRFDHIDINDGNAVLRAQNTKYDEVYHFACPTGVPNIAIYGEEMMRTCSQGTENILNVAKLHNATLVYTSSAEVYGDPKEFPQVENYHGNVNPVGERSTYEEGKRFGEMLVKLYVEKYHLKAKIVRIFNSYGPNMSKLDTRLIPNTLTHIKAGQPLTIFGNGTQTRTHLYISDLLTGLEIVMKTGESASPYNVGGNTQLSINQLVRALSDVIGRELPVEYKEHFIEDHGGREPDVSKLMQLGWRIQTELSTGLAAMCNEFGIPIKEAVNEKSYNPQQWPNRPIHELPV